ncbi:nothepsin, partial [Silurus meridionalis]
CSVILHFVVCRVSLVKKSTIMKERGILKEMLKSAQFSYQDGYPEDLINQNDVFNNPYLCTLQVAYFGKVGIGSPPQYFYLHFDTGSSTLWVNSVNCKSDACRSHTLFNPHKSSTFSSSKHPFSVKYGTGSVKGFLGYDTITMGQLRVKHQQIGLSTEEPGNHFAKPLHDGLLGLAFKPSDSPTIVNTMIKEGVIDEPIFAFYLSRDSEHGSEVVFGGVDHSHYQGEINWVPVQHDSHWQLNFEGFEVNGHSTGFCDQGCTAITDTGTSLLLCPPQYVHSLHHMLGAKQDGNGNYVFDCDAVSSLPTLTFIMNGAHLHLPGSAYVLRNGGSGSHCKSGIKASKDKERDGHPFWTLGDVFLRQFYSVFDQGHARVGFATLA